MKKLFALLLVACMLLGLVACGKKDPTTTNPTGSNSTDPTGSNNSADPQLTMTPEKSPYNGKTLEIYGMGLKENFDFSKVTKLNYNWMMYAAMEEWAAMNGVTLNLKGAYNHQTVLADISAGGHPDLIFQFNVFPAVSNNSLTTAWTDEEYTKLAAIAGENYLDMVDYAGKSHGFVVPWTGTYMLYYNASMFERYGVTTPKEYFLNGEWNWANLVKCMEEMTKDVDSDGTTDTYGLNFDSLACLLNPIKTNEAGELVTNIDDENVQDFIQFVYDNVTVKQTVLNPGKNNIQSNITYPMQAMQMSDCEPYNFKHMFQEIGNGDWIEAVPIPEWIGDNGEKTGMSQVTQAAMHLCSATDDRDAVVDMLVYVLKCGMKYISDYSLGAVKCDYVGVQGKCDASRQWKELFAKECATRATEAEELGENYDQELVTKANEYLDDRGRYIMVRPSGVTLINGYKEIIQMPPASSIPAIREKYQAQLEKYNNTYIRK